MDTVYIVVKNSKPVKIEGEEFKIPFKTNEGVFYTEDEATNYIKERKVLKDRDDRSCTFTIEPWTVGMVIGA